MRLTLLFFALVAAHPSFGLEVNLNDKDAATRYLKTQGTAALVHKIEAPKGFNFNLNCFSINWFEDHHIRDFELRDRLSSFILNNPQAFVETQIGTEEYLCFVVEKLSIAEFELLDDLLLAVDVAVSSRVIVGLPDQKNKHASSIFQKLGRAELIVGSSQLATFSTLLLLPKSVTGWKDNFTANLGANYKRAFSKAPVIDDDSWKFNYLAHPVAGAFYYNSLRSQNATVLQSLLWSTAQSTIWEYGFEASVEQPSIQDLIVTPIIGSLLGEAAHQGTLKMKKNGFNTLEKFVITIINPSYVLNNGHR